ncbi:MAG: radical SAM protein [Patescibacteria group bacterium]|nr:B12-binding domain-containing radical SAM protein [Patescibacteria group bacterium]
MKILLINPPYINFEGMKESGGHIMPFNLAYLAAYLRQRNDCSVKIFDTEALSLNYSEIKQYLAKEKPDLIGFTCLSPTINHILKICRIVKKDLNLKSSIVLGGIHPTIFPKETIKNQYIDFVVVGEGEITFTELVKAIQEKRTDFENINGLYYKKNGEIVKTQPRELISDLDTIPFPARDLFNLDLYSSAPTKKLTDEQCSPILTSRGCTFNCIHCVSKSIWQRKIRYRSSDNIISEIEECINKYNIKEFSILDDNFTLNKSRAIEFCQKVIEKKLLIAWICFSRADGINDQLIKIMAEAGCKKISLGLESGSQKILNLMRKQTTIEQGKKAVEIIRKNNILVHASFMIGNIGETEETVKETINFAKSLDLDNASFFITCPVPGSDLYYYAQNEGFIEKNTSWEMFAPLSNTPPVLTQNNLSQNDLIYWQKKAFRKFYFRPKYIYRKLKQIKSWEGIKTIFQGIKILLRILIKPKSRTT